jgi:hypothetical protein
MLMRLNCVMTFIDMCDYRHSNANHGGVRRACKVHLNGILSQPQHTLVNGAVDGRTRSKRLNLMR